MKKLFSLVFLLLFLTLILFGGCGDTEELKHNSGDVFYTVLFDSDGGTSVSSQNVRENCKIVKPINPTKKNTETLEFIFNGWYYGENLWDFKNGTVVQNMVLVAHWEQRTYTGDINIRR